MSFSRSSSKPRPPLDENGLHEYAVRALGRRMRTEAELRRLLSARVEPEESGATKVRAVLARLREYGYLNDASFAETYTRLRQENEKFGARRVRQDLHQKGVASSQIEEAVQARYGAVDEVALARQHLERKRIAAPTNEKETARVMRRLVGAGFSTGAIRSVLRQWKVAEESLEALDNLEDSAAE